MSTAILQAAGPLRLALGTFVLATVALAPWAGGEPHGWQAVPAYVAPVLAVLLFWLLLLDLLMARVFMGEGEAQRARFTRVTRFDLTLLALLLLAWSPFFLGLLL